MKSSLLSLILACSFINPVFAKEINTPNLVPARDYIQNLDQTLQQAKKDSAVTVEFPTVIPKPTKIKKYFASYDETSKQNGFAYMINVDSTSDCHGVKYCNIGVVSARSDSKIDMMTDKENKVITTKVMLADGLDGYYTPGHAMGDFFPASIQWLDNKVLYTITWNADVGSKEAIRQSLITMANSAKHPGAG